MAKDEDTRARAQAVSALERIGPAAVPGLREGLRDKDVRVRSGAATALGRIGPDARAAVPALIEALKDEVADVRVQVPGALGGHRAGSKGGGACADRRAEGRGRPRRRAGGPRPGAHRAG